MVRPKEYSDRSGALIVERSASYKVGSAGKRTLLRDGGIDAGSRISGAQVEEGIWCEDYVFRSVGLPPRRGGPLSLFHRSQTGVNESSR